jgi:hypothetical protein
MNENMRKAFESNKSYEPIMKQLAYWKDYNMRDSERKVKRRQADNMVCSDDEFRAANDRDCILTGGNLNADTIFSLWLPLRHTITRINSKEAIAKVGNINDKKSFVCALLEGDNLEKLLPKNLSIVHTLSELFIYGMGRENVMLLPKRYFCRGERTERDIAKCTLKHRPYSLNCARGCKPYWDYIPHFLYELFEGGDFADAVGNDDETCRTWIRNQKMTIFFQNGILDREHIIDLAGSGDVKVSLAPTGNSYEEGLMLQEKKLRNYINLLKLRKNEVNEWR